MELFKVVVVGDQNCEKTKILHKFVYGDSNEWIPTLLDNYACTIKHEELEDAVKVMIWDTAGQEDYSRLRTLCYPNTDLFILCYLKKSLQSYDNVMSIWEPELRLYGPDVPILLLGIDTSEDSLEYNCLKSIRVLEIKQSDGYYEKEDIEREDFEIEQEAKTLTLLGEKIKAWRVFECRLDGPASILQQKLRDIIRDAMLLVVNLRKYKNKRHGYSYLLNTYFLNTFKGLYSYMTRK